MNPKPFASLNHFTVPVWRMRYSQWIRLIGRGTLGSAPHAWAFTSRPRTGGAPANARRVKFGMGCWKGVRNCLVDLLRCGGAGPASDVCDGDGGQANRT